MPIKRIALIFDNTERPETTGLYCRRALGNLLEVEHFLPSETSRIPRGIFDLFLNVDDGLRYRLPDDLRPSAYWAIDTHMNWEWSLEKARDFDSVFAAQRDGAERLIGEGIETATWLPLACDPEIHCKHGVPKTVDVCFVGNVFPGERAELLELIQKRFEKTFIGRRYLYEMARTYSTSRLVFNRSVRNDVNMRVFEALACGSMLITNDLAENGQGELFQDGAHLATYSSGEELIDKIAFYLERDKLREQIAVVGRSEALSRHTYLHRMVRLLRCVERGLSKTTVGPPKRREESPRSTDEQKAPGKVSACLVSWRRPENVRRIIERLRSEPLIDDIVVWNNDPTTKLDIDDENVTVVQSDGNMVTYGRYLCARHAKHDVIYTQDDDCLVHNMGELFETFELNPTCIAHNLKLGHLMRNMENIFDQAQVALVGWGAFFKREWCNVFENYVTSFGEDELLHRKADRIFSLLLNRRHRSLPAAVEDLPGASGTESLSVKDDHLELTRQAISRALRILRGGAREHAQRETVEAERAMSTAPAERVGSTKGGAKDSWYFQFSRPELIEMIPGSAMRVLDIGCGTGALGEQLKQRRQAEVWGIEREEEAAEVARKHLDRVLTTDVEQIESELEADSFDCIVCGDVLEHLREPGQLLRKARTWLSVEGRLIASIPNVRHHSVITGLLDGNWTYEAAGLLDQDHVRFFTRREIEKLFYRAGFEVCEIRLVPGPGHREWAERGRRGEVRIGSLHIAGMTAEDAEEFHVYQYLVSVRPEVRRIREEKLREHESEPVASESGTDAAFEADQKKLIQGLSNEFGWPPMKPAVPIPTEHTGWLADGARELLGRELGEHTRLVVELGAWLGLSTRFIADHARQADVLTVDHWRGNVEHQQKPQWQRMLPTLYETFLAMSWSYRDRIIPLKMTTQEALRKIGDLGLRPDLVFFDAEHSYEAVTADLELCRALFPEAELVGDDLDDPDVGKAVRDFADRKKLDVEAAGTQWHAWRLVERRPTTLVPVSSEDYGLTSIVIVTHNELSYTQQCISSIRQFTDEPYELVLVDNGSTDGTVEYLESVSGATVTVNRENRGFPAAANQGIRASRGRQIMLLNNDTVVTTGWLRRLLKALKSDENVGLVGPCSNYVASPQEIPVSYQDLSGVDGFAWDWGKKNDGRRIDIDRLVGFCLLISRNVIEDIGLLDEQFGVGCFEDDDYCRRAKQAGYRVVIATDSFIHHFGSRTFFGSGVDFASVLSENQKRYQAKWGGPPALQSGPASAGAETRQQQVLVAGRAPEFDMSVAPGGGLVLEKKHVRLSLCMIVRDNEKTIEACLKSIRPWVDEMVVVDTGSKDRTQQIVEELGGRLFHFPWCDDFSAARNESLKYAAGDWVFWMDSDDTISEECGRRLRDLACGEHDSRTLGYVMQVHCPGADEEGRDDLTIVDHVKLFRNRLGLQFEGRIHEQIIPAIRRAGGEVAFTDISVVHSGSDHSVEGRKGKLERDFRLLRLEFEEEPDHPFVLFNLGMTHADCEQYEEAIKYLNRCIEVSHAEESHLRKAYALLVNAYAQSDRHDSAWGTCQTGLKLFPDDKELLFRAGMLHHHLGRLEEAEQTYLRALHDHEERHFTSVDSGIAGAKARHNLAIVYEDMGELDKAEEQWRVVLQEKDRYRPGWRGLGETLLKRGDLGAVESMAAELKGEKNLGGLGAVFAARLLERRGDINAARSELEQACAESSGDLDPLRELCRLLFERGDPSEAELALKRLCEGDPEDGAVLHNLGTVYSRMGRYEEAASAYRRSLKVRRKSPNTSLHLGYALRDIGRIQEARNVWLAGLALSPQDASLNAALDDKSGKDESGEMPPI